MLTQGTDPAFEGSVFRGEALTVAELSTDTRAEPPRGTVALFTDSLGGMGASTAKNLVRHGYAVRLYVL